jgi:hypothetical protein
MARLSISFALAVALPLLLCACASHHEEGVTSSYHSQWTVVNADTKTTTEAARAVLEAEGLNEIKATSTNVDGTASAKKADGTKVDVAVKKKTDTSSEVSLSVGTLGDPALGAEMVKKIKTRAEGGVR